MVEKYIELITPISESEEIGSSVHHGVKLALEWLDDHPDQAPGLTITESEFREACEYEDQAHRASSPHTYAERVMFALGITVVPDPKPTNAAKLAEQISVAWGPREWHDGYDDHIKRIAERLDEQGVKAPGGDDD